MDINNNKQVTERKLSAALTGWRRARLVDCLQRMYLESTGQGGDRKNVVMASGGTIGAFVSAELTADVRPAHRLKDTKV